MLRKIAGVILFLIAAVMLLIAILGNLMITSLSTAAYAVVIGFLGYALYTGSSRQAPYASAPRRAAALFIDGLILGVPALFVQALFFLTNPTVFVLGNLLFGYLCMGIWIYFVVRYGATPGKMVMEIVIVTDDFQKVGLRHALLRTSVDLGIATVTNLAMFSVVYSIDWEPWRSAGFFQQMQGLASAYPPWLMLLVSLHGFWTWSEIIVMALNPRRKAIHDYIAGTVVVKKADLPDPEIQGDGVAVPA